MAPGDVEQHAIEAILDCQRLFWQALKHKDADQLALLLADNFICRSPGEPAQDRTAFIQTIIHMPVIVDHVTATQIAVDYFDTIAVLTGIQIATIQLPNGNQINERLALTNVFRHTAGKWQMILAHPVSLHNPE